MGENGAEESLKYAIRMRGIKWIPTKMEKNYI